MLDAKFPDVAAMPEALKPIESRPEQASIVEQENVLDVDPYFGRERA